MHVIHPEGKGGITQRMPLTYILSKPEKGERVTNEFKLEKTRKISTLNHNIAFSR